MDTETKTTIEINYLLDEAGRREALALGMEATERQVLSLGRDDEGFDAALALASVSTDGEAVLDVGFERHRDGTEQVIQVPDMEDEALSWAMSMWSAPQPASVLLAWEVRRRAGVARIKPILKAKERADEARRKSESEAARKAREADEEAARKAQKIPRLADLDAYVATFTPQQAADEGVRKAVEIDRDWAEHAKNWHYEDVRKAVWIATHGSDRLRRCVIEDIECDAIYRDERLAYERPGWRWSAEVRGNGDVSRNPSADAFALLDEARTFDGEAAIGYWTAKPKTDDDGESGYYGDEDDRLRPWRGYIATARFLDREIIFFGDQDAPE